MTNDLIPAQKNEIVVYQPNETLRLEVRVENESVWLTQSKIGELFGVDRTVINRHIHNIYRTCELKETATCAKIAQVQNEGGRKIRRIVPFYDLERLFSASCRNRRLEPHEIGARRDGRPAPIFGRWGASPHHDFMI